MHGRVNQARVRVVALHVTGAIEPVHPEHVHFVRRIMVSMNEFHDPA